MRIFKLCGFALLFSSLVACIGLQSQSANVYEYDGKQWLILNRSTVAEQTGIRPGLDTYRAVAVQRSDGSFQIIGESSVENQKDEVDAVTRWMDPHYRRFYAGRNEIDPTGTLIQTLVRDGTLRSKVDAAEISVKNGIVTVPDSAISPAFARREGEGGMY